jgi:PAS domain S-box-containing protein
MGALKENFRLNDIITRIARMGAWRIDLVNNVIWWSDITREIHEVDKDFELDLETAINFYVEEHRPIITRLVENGIKHDSSWDVNLQIRTAKGNVVWVRAIGFAVRDESGNPIALEGVFQDVNELVATKSVLEEYQQAIDSLSQVMVSKEFYDIQQNFQEALKIGTEYLGFDLGIISRIEGGRYQVLQSCSQHSDLQIEVGTEFELSNTYCSLVVEKDDAVIIDQIGLSEYSGHPAYKAFQLEAYMAVPLKVKGKSFGTLNFTAKSDRAGNITPLHQKFVNFLGTWVEMIIERQDLLTEYARNFEEAQKNRARFEAVFDDTPSAMIFANINREIISVNRKFIQLFGYQLNEVEGKSTEMLYANVDDFKKDGEEHFNINSERDISPHIISYKRKDGTTFQGERIGVQVKENDNKLIGYLGIIRDLTEEIETEKLIHKQNIELEKERALSFQNSKMAALGQMAGGVSHEINNPLTIIEGFSKNLIRKIEKKGEVDNKTLVKTLEKVVGASERISKIVLGLKTFARDDRNDDMQRVNVKAMIDETLSFCLQRFQNNGVELISSDIKDDWFFKGHSVQVSQVVLNLLNNAFDAVSEQDGMTAPWIKVQVFQVEDEIHFRVQDSGKGIEEEVVKSLMNPFFTTKEVGKGTGLGLSISQSIIEKHGGKLKYELYEGQTSFCFSLILDK